MDKDLSPYEAKALAEIRAWKRAKPGRTSQAWEALSGPLRRAAGGVKNPPGLDWAAEKAAGRVVDLSNDLAHLSVRPERIYAEFTEYGLDITGPGDIWAADLEVPDRAAAGLPRKYKALSAAEGAAAGAAGLPGVAADIVALIGLNQRAAAEYAAYYGFDITDGAERIFAMSLLGYASLSTERDQRRALSELAELGRRTAVRRTRTEMQKYTYLNVVKRMAGAVGMKLGRAKMAQIAPIVGAGVGAGLNAAYTARVCQAAGCLYRERFLAAKYGRGVLETQGTAPDDIEAMYDDLVKEFEEGE